MGLIRYIATFGRGAAWIRWITTAGIVVITAACASEDTSYVMEVGGLAVDSDATNSTGEDSNSSSTSGSVDTTEVDDAGEMIGQVRTGIPAGGLPDIEMIDVATGATVNLQSLTDNNKLPLLFWFFAPH